MTAENRSILSQRHNDCLACRLVSGGGLTGMGVYVWYHGKSKVNTLQRVSMYSLASIAVGIGIARLFDLYPFKTKNKRN